jgi:hypothetical protein
MTAWEPIPSPRRRPVSLLFPPRFQFFLHCSCLHVFSTFRLYVSAIRADKRGLAIPMIYVRYGDAHYGTSIPRAKPNFHNDFTYIHSECNDYYAVTCTRRARYQGVDHSRSTKNISSQSTQVLQASFCCSRPQSNRTLKIMSQIALASSLGFSLPLSRPRQPQNKIHDDGGK